MMYVADPARAQGVTIAAYRTAWACAHTYDPRQSSPEAWLLALVREQAKAGP